MKLENYNLEVNKIKKYILETNPKSVLIQLPDGLKPFATEILDKINDGKRDFFIWAGSCFGACDIPNAKVDLIIQFGHIAFK